MSIPFTQYLRPHGWPKDVSINRSPEIERLATEFLAAGGRFENEVLMTGEVSLTAMLTVEGNDETVAIVISENGPAVPAAVDRLVTKAAKFVKPSSSSPSPEQAQGAAHS